DGNGPHLREVVSNSRSRHEYEILQAVVRRVDDRIDDDVDRLQVPAHDRSNLRGVALLVPMLRIDAEFEIGAVEKPAVVGVWHGEERAELETVECSAVVILVDAVQGHVQAGLEPARDAVRPFGDAIQRLIRDDRAGKCRRLHAARSEIIVHREVQDAPGSQSSVVHLNLVALSARGWANRQHQGYGKASRIGKRMAHEAPYYPSQLIELCFC